MTNSDRPGTGWGRRVGVLGGSFDPVHHAHLFSAEVAGAAVGLQQVLLVPASQSPLKGRASASAADRVAMLRLAAAGNPRLAVSTIDVDRPPPSYTVDTLALLRQRLGGAGGDPPLELYLILGLDALQEFLEWREPERTLDLCRLIVVPRPGYDLALPPALVARLGARVTRILLQPMPRLEISSTDIRRRIGAGEPVRYLLPEAVERYIGEHGLYRGAPARVERAQRATRGGAQQGAGIGRSPTGEARAGRGSRTASDWRRGGR